MAFGEHSPAGIGDRDGDRAAVLEPERQRLTNQRLEIGCCINRAFDAVHAGDRQPGVLDEPLIARDPVTHLRDRTAVGIEVANARIFLD